MTAIARRLLSLTLPALVGFAVVFAMLLRAEAGPPETVAVAYAGPDDVAGDVFSAGRRVGLLWLAIGLAVAVVLRWTVARLKPKEGRPAPKPGSVRARLIMGLTGLASVVAALVDMYAASRGMMPVALAASGAIGLYFALGDDPERGSKRRGDEEPTP
jgi:hypothetical protein